ncbi:MAG TPA: hypothetical protein DD381_06100 [Lentisphaeria bacterium]|nr:hypothetical protein [Lentisphaeria bacterium]
MTSLGNLDSAMGAVWYCAGGSQTILADTYSTLVVRYGGIKTLGGTVTVNNALGVYAGSTLSVGANTLTVNGTSNIIGTLTLGTGTIDANSKFNATGGIIDFTGAGNLRLGGSTITSLGTLDSALGTVWYDRAGAQTLLADTYYNLTTSGSGIKTLGGTVTVENTLATGATEFALNNNILNIGSLNIGTGTWTNTAAFSKGTGAVYYADSTDQTILALNYCTLGVSDSNKTFADGTTKVDNEILISSNMSGKTLTGSSASAVTVQVTTPGIGGTASRVFNVEIGDGNTITISRMTIKGGDISGKPHPNEAGGGIYVWSGTLNLDASSVSGSKAVYGGGIFSWRTMTITNSTVSGNTAGAGGGVYSVQTAMITNSTVSENSSAGDGGGIYSSASGLMTIINSTVSGNSSAGSGGGIYFYSGYFYMLNTIIINNVATEGGDIYNYLGTEVNTYYCWYHDTHGGPTGGLQNQTSAYDGSLGSLALNSPGTTETMAVSTGTALGNGTWTYNTNNTPDGYYFLSIDGRYHQLTNYATSQESEPIGKITTDQRGVTRGTPVTIGAYQTAEILPITLLALPFARRVKKGSEEVLSSLGKGISAKLHKHDLFKTEIDHLIEAIA